MSRTIAVTRTNIIGTRNQVYTAWEVTGSWPTHTTISSFDAHGWAGRIGTEATPPDIDRLDACSDERAEAYYAWRESTYQTAYGLIRRAFPGLEGCEDMGKIEDWSDQTGSETRWISGD